MDKWTCRKRFFFILSLKTKAQVQASEKRFDVGKIPRTKCIYFPRNFHCNKLAVAFLLLGEVKVVSHSCQGIVM